mgnify:CR=1 FL=1|jgi:hypothetical protein
MPSIHKTICNVKLLNESACFFKLFLIELKLMRDIQ